MIDLPNHINCLSEAGIQPKFKKSIITFNSEENHECSKVIIEKITFNGDQCNVFFKKNALDTLNKSKCHMANQRKENDRTFFWSFRYFSKLYKKKSNCVHEIPDTLLNHLKYFFSAKTTTYTSCGDDDGSRFKIAACNVIQP